MAEYTEKIPQHRHCVACGRAFTGQGDFCSEECRSSAGSEAKSKLRKLGLVWLAIVVATVALIVVTL